MNDCYNCGAELNMSEKYSRKRILIFEEYSSEFIEVHVICELCKEPMFLHTQEEESKYIHEAEKDLAFKIEIANKEKTKELSPGSRQILEDIKNCDRGYMFHSQYLLLQKMIYILEIDELEAFLHTERMFSNYKRME